MRFVFFTLEETYLEALRRAALLAQERSGASFVVDAYTAGALARPEARAAAAAALRQADAVFASMLFFEEHVGPVGALLSARDSTGAPIPVVALNCAADLLSRTRLGALRLDTGWAARLMSRAGARRATLRPSASSGADVGRRLLGLTRSLPRLLRAGPGASSDLGRYLQFMQYWVHGTPANLSNLLLTVAAHYGPPEARRALARVPIAAPVEMPAAAIFHPDAPGPFTTVAAYRAWRAGRGLASAGAATGVVGLVSLRSSILTGATAHVDALVRALDLQGLEPVPTYAGGLDMRGATRRFFGSPGADGADGTVPIDTLINLSGFPLVGGMAHSDAPLAEAELRRLDRPLLTGIPLNFQSLSDWRASATGVTPAQIAMQIALPELEGAVEPTVYGGAAEHGARDFAPEPANVERLAGRAARWARLARKGPAARRVGIVLFNFPPNGGAVGSAAYLAVFPSLLRLLRELKAEGYDVALPPDAETLRRLIVEGNAAEFGTPANVAAALGPADYRRLCPWHDEISGAGWGPPPGAINSDGERILILGREFGAVFVGVQPPFGYEGDPMKLLLSQGITPNHGFAGFYAWLRGVWQADALLSLGTHGALEFMPGKQAGLSAACWPVRLLGDSPHLYIYSANNPSEGSIARRRGAATLVSYLSPPIEQAGLYRGLLELKAAIRALPPGAPDAATLDSIGRQAAGLRLPWPDDASGDLAPATAALYSALVDLETRLIPLGLHEIGRPPAAGELVDLLLQVAWPARPDLGLPGLGDLLATALGVPMPPDGLDSVPTRDQLAGLERAQDVGRAGLARLLAGGAETGEAEWAAQGVAPDRARPLLRWLAALAADLTRDVEPQAVIHAVGAGYIPPSPGADVVRNPAVVPTGRNIHALDPFSVPTALAWDAGRRVADGLLDRYRRERGDWPRALAVVLWGTDNLKTGGEGIAQALWLLGAEPYRDALGRVTGARLLPLASLGRPRIDVVLTCSGIFRDLLPNQLHVLDQAARLAATADEPLDQNFVRRNALAATDAGLTAEEAATRVFSNAPGAYGANINFQIESGAWEDDQMLADTFLARKSFAYGLSGDGRPAAALLASALRSVDAAFQNIDSIETGVSDIDHYFEYLGGVSKAVEQLTGARPASFVLDTQGVGGRLRSLPEMVAVESRTKLLNPRWTDGMLRFGYEGVREIGVRVANTFGWSATADAVPGWIYDDLAATYVLDPARREQMAALNPNAYQGLVGRLLEAEGRGFWSPPAEVSAALRRVYGEAEDLVERVG